MESAQQYWQSKLPLSKCFKLLLVTHEKEQSIYHFMFKITLKEFFKKEQRKAPRSIM